MRREEKSIPFVRVVLDWIRGPVWRQDVDESIRVHSVCLVVKRVNVAD